MKSKSEIESKLGIKLEYISRKSNIEDYENITITYLTEKSEKDLINLQLQSLQNGDIETAELCNRILKEDTYIKRGRYDKEQSEELRTLEQENVEHIIAEIENMNENVSIEELEDMINSAKLYQSGCEHVDNEIKGRLSEKLENLRRVLGQKIIPEVMANINGIDENTPIEDIESKIDIVRKYYGMDIDKDSAQKISEEIKKVSNILTRCVSNKRALLNNQMAELKEHLEIPENEDKLKGLQAQLESLEDKYYGKSAKESRNARRVQEEGLDMEEIMQNISEYRIYGRSYIDDENFDRLNAQIVKKTEFLERKLAFIQEHKDIPGNAERIAELESQIETMQDSWIVAQKGYNNMDGILQTAESRKNEIQNRLVQSKKEIETIDPMSREYIQKRNQIENLTKEVIKYEKYIEKMQQTKTEIENGENPSFMGKHHRDRLQREEQERVETNRGKIQDLEGQIAELQKHIEIPENEQRIIDLQAQIDEIEATIPSDRGNHKRERLQEQGRDTEAIMTDIDDIIVRFNDPYVQGKAERIDTEIKTRVAYLENKMNYLKQHLYIAGNEERVAKLQSQIEQIEDKWELCTQGFGSKEQIEQRIRVTKAHLHTTLMSFKGNKELKLSPEQMQEYWNKIQNSEEVPELFGQHHRERLEREKETRIRAEQQEKDMLEQEYGLAGIEDRETLQRRLEDIVSKGIFLGADKASEKKVAEFERMKQVIPRFEEFKSVYLQLRQAGLEDDLYANMDFQNVSFDDLLERATTILEEKAKAEEQRTEIEQPEVIIEEQPEVVTNPEQVVEETIEDEPSVAGETIEDTTATVTGTNIDIDNASMMEAHLEYMRNHQTQQTSQVVEDYWNEIHSQQAKVYEQPQPEKIRTREKSIKDEVEDELRTTEQHTQKQDNPSVDLWMNRFNGWYSAIDRVSQSVKEKFVKMKSDIIKAISEKLKERTNNRQFNTQEQDTNER